MNEIRIAIGERLLYWALWIMPARSREGQTLARLLLDYLHDVTS